MGYSVVFGDSAEKNIVYLFNKYGFPDVYLELGVFEGHTFFNVAQILNKNSRIIGIDPFVAVENLKKEVVDNAKLQFFENILQFPSAEFIEKTSFNGLLELHQSNTEADFIFIDGSHYAKDVLLDSTLSFELLKPGGILLFDDCVSWRYGDIPQNSPKVAVDSFIQCNWDRLDIIHLPDAWQVAVRKR